MDADELVTLYERFKNEQLVAEEEAEELDEEYLKRARCGITLPRPHLSHWTYSSPVYPRLPHLTYQLIGESLPYMQSKATRRGDVSGSRLRGSRRCRSQA